MKSLFRFGLVAGIVVLVLYACTFPPTSNPAVQPPLDGLPALGLAVQATNATNVFNTVGQVINYSYTVTNTGIPPLAGPVTVADDKTAAPVCAALTTVGNADNNLDRGETVTCTSTYPITQADLNTGTVTNNSTARAGSTDSNRVTTVVRMAENKVLALTVVANPTTYSAAGQSITLTYTIKNTGTTALGPTQFIVRDDHISAPINCDVPNRTLGPGESITCAPATYVTTQNDMGVNQFVITATASGGGAGSIQPATSTITKAGIPPPPPPTTPPPAGNLTPGTTVTYTMKEGEWLMQVFRCYGKDPGDVYDPPFRSVNPQIFNPNFVKAGTVVTIPTIGSKGTIYYPNCFTSHIVVSGDSWETVGSKYNAAVDVLKAANKNVTFGNGVCLKIPLNSAGGTSVPAPTAASCAGGTNPPPPPSAIRITFPAGGTSATLSGTVPATGSVKYVFTANQGQLLSVKLNAPANEVSLGITAPNGSTLKPQDTTLTFTGTIPATGDSFIDIKGVSGSTNKAYTLEISITTPSTSTVERVADINTGINNSDPAYLSVFNNVLYFKATGSDNAGSEFWKYDPATKTATRVADIFAGATGSDPAYLTVFSGALYFKANGNDGGGVELWRFNGSASGRLTDINSGAGDANPAYLAVFNNALYFSAKGSDGAGVELWKTDGTTAIRAADINAGPGDSNPAYLTVFNNALYFSAASTDGAGVELWKFDGTTATRVADINVGVGNSNPAHLAVFNNALYFSANANDGKGIELWKFDGTTTTLAADLNSGAGDSAPSFLTVFNSALYFSANGNDGSGTELWKYDGTTSKRVGDINTAGNSNPSYLAVFNNELYFQANSNDGTGTELWKFKGP